MREETRCEIRTQLTIIKSTSQLIERRVATGKPYSEAELGERLKSVENATSAILVALARDEVQDQAAQLA